ncbi:hypothetical protein [Phragmitibacter flavus]|uniref:hypothetical protein n=1 Tax=Phragmitibacter flavus TaxID=2576071 RepID=UPI001F0EC622|nr:hypothetical protein [Phragmitibacter flavus]
MMKPLLSIVFLGFFASLVEGREFRELTNLEGRKIKAELLDLTPEGVLKGVFNLKPFEIALDQLSEEDRVWLKKWDAEKKLGKDAAYYDRLIFEDDFSGEGFGPKWGHYKSNSVVKDGVLVGITGVGSDHAAVDNIKFEGEQDLEVSVKFKFVSAEAKRFDIWFDDKDFKGAHAGHVCQVSVSPTQVQVMDAKEGMFRNDLNAKRKAPEGFSAEEKKYLETKVVRWPVKVTLNEWHTLVARTKGDEVTVTLNGDEVGVFKSEGVAHETKSLVSLTTNLVDVHYDDFSVKAGGGDGKVKSEK